MEGAPLDPILYCHNVEAFSLSFATTQSSLQLVSLMRTRLPLMMDMRLDWILLHVTNGCLEGRQRGIGGNARFSCQASGKSCKCRPPSTLEFKDSARGITQWQVVHVMHENGALHTLKSKWRPYNLADSSAFVASILRAISSPFFAFSTALWLISMLAILPSMMPPFPGTQSGVPTCITASIHL